MHLHHDGRLAQLVEHLPYKEGVTGSSPVSPTTSHDSPASLRYGSLAQLVEQLTFNQLVTGSNPVRPTIVSLSPDYIFHRYNTGSFLFVIIHFPVPPNHQHSAGQSPVQ